VWLLLAVFAYFAAAILIIATVVTVAIAPASTWKSASRPALLSRTLFGLTPFVSWPFVDRRRSLDRLLVIGFFAHTN
jgi:hypothetical protein